MKLPLDKLWDEWKRLLVDNGVVLLFGVQPFTSELVMSNLKWFRYELIWEKERPTNVFFMKKQFGRVHENILVFYKHQPTYNPIMEKREGIKPSEKRFREYSQYKNNSSLTHKGQKYQMSDEYQADYRYPRSVIKKNRELKGDKIRHPTSKPTRLLEYLIKTFTNEGDNVLDCVAGGGSTGVACQRCGRKCVLIEKDKGFYDLILKNLESNS